MRRFASAILGLFLAGCLGGPEGDPVPDDAGGFQPGPATVRPEFDFSQAIEFEHDHEDPSLHMGSYGLELVGWTAMNEAARAGTMPGGFNEVSVGTRLALVSNFGPHRVVSVVNVSEPQHPRHVSDWWASDFLDPASAGASSAWGVTIFPQDDLGVVSVQVMSNPPLPGSEDQQGGGLFLLNLDDPTAPKEESFTSVSDPDALIPVGVHTVRVFEADGERYVAATTANGQTILYEVTGEAPHRTLREVSRVIGIHDTAVQVHPVTGQRILYAAQGGVYLTDITDPSKPELLSSVRNGEGGLQAYHQVVPSDVLIEGRHLTVAATESAEGEPTPFTLLDTTDPVEPKVLGQWTLPLVLPAPTGGNAYRFTGHNLDFDRGRLYIGHSHAGVWVVDVSRLENANNPFPIAFYQPHEEVLYGPLNPFSGPDVPAVWSAYRGHDGYVYASDANTGLYILRVTEPPSPYEGAPIFPHNVR